MSSSLSSASLQDSEDTERTRLARLSVAEERSVLENWSDQVTVRVNSRYLSQGCLVTDQY